MARLEDETWYGEAVHSAYILLSILCVDTSCPTSYGAEALHNLKCGRAGMLFHYIH
jgi:hypothetical protein